MASAGGPGVGHCPGADLPCVPQALPYVCLLIAMLFFIYAIIGMQVRVPPGRGSGPWAEGIGHALAEVASGPGPTSTLTLLCLALAPGASRPACSLLFHFRCLETLPWMMTPASTGTTTSGRFYKP